MSTFTVEQIEPSDLRAPDLRRDAAGLVLAGGLDGTETAENITELLAGVSTQEPFRQHPALAYRLTINGQAMTADVLVAVDAGRVGIAWGSDAQWGELHIAPDLITVEGGDAYADELYAAINDWLNDAEGWEARA